MSVSPQLVGTYRTEVKTIDDSYSTRPARVFAAGANGSRVHQASLVNTDNAAQTAFFSMLKQMTLQSDMGVATHVDGGGGSDTFTRTTGSFITNGWKVGDIAYFYNSTTRANDFKVELTAVAALTLTFATGTTNTGEVFPAGGIIYKIAQLSKPDVPASAGNSSGIPAIDLLDDAVNPIFDASPDRYLVLGPNDALAVACGTAVGAGEQFDVFIGAGDY